LCIGLPARVVSVEGSEASVQTGRGPRRVILALPEQVRKGDYVILMGDAALSKIDRRTALETLADMKRIALSAAEEDGDDTTAIERLYRRRAELLEGRRV
jgi:hydrogenase expression/formation protein HypC